MSNHESWQMLMFNVTPDGQSFLGFETTGTRA
jgi:hypothetical protein